MLILLFYYFFLTRDSTNGRHIVVTCMLLQKKIRRCVRQFTHPVSLRSSVCFFFFLRSSFLSFLSFEQSSRSSTHRRKNDTYPAWITCTDIFAEVFSKRKCLNNNCSVKRSAEFRVLGYLESIIRSGNIVLKAIILKFLKREERGMVNKEIARLDRFNNL